MFFIGLDNPLLNRLVNYYRTLSGNKLIDKSESPRNPHRLARNETVGILADQNTLPEEGFLWIFSAFLLALRQVSPRLRCARKPAVVPAFCVWKAKSKKFQIIFSPPLELCVTGNSDEDISRLRSR